MKYNPLTNAFDTPIPPSNLTGEEELALWHENGLNHPVTRESVAAKFVRLAKEQAEKNKQE